MTLANWTLSGPSIQNDHLPALHYKMAKGFKASFSTSNPGNSAIPYTYLVGWDSAAATSSSSGTFSPDANNLQNFLSDVLGYAYIEQTGVTTYQIHRVLPDSLFDWPVFFAQNATVEGWGVPGESPYTYEQVYPTAKVQVDYKPLNYAVKEDSELSGNVGEELERFVTRGFGFDSQYLTVNGAMKYCTTPYGQVATQPGKITSTQELNYTWHLVPGLAGNPFTPPNISAIMSCIGTVNSVAFDTVAGINAPPGTVLFTSADVTLELPSLGGSEAQAYLTNGISYYWTIVFKFSYRNNGVYDTRDPGHTTNKYYPGVGGNALLNGVPIGHNFVYRTYGQPASPATQLQLPFWDLLTNDGSFTVTAGSPPTVSGVTIYQSSDLNTLFTITG
jgi:hypothetical protein